eukprot:TRINITY_DN27486_c0_g1_i1.p1 TRINITY_DN27486_c0_g1~~TRINITY_DN27486_c0_g1_i1.p1  ORF type:complete len:341 (+),score=26.24 TRINITY_DN27486_c0_g1_i1:49-1071(+)
MAAIPAAMKTKRTLDEAQRVFNQQLSSRQFKMTAERARIVVPEGYQVPKPVEIELPGRKNWLSKHPEGKNAIIDVEVGNGGGLEIWIKTQPKCLQPDYTDLTINVTGGQESAVALVTSPGGRSPVWAAILSALLRRSKQKKRNMVSMTTNGTMDKNSILYSNLVHPGGAVAEVQRDSFNIALNGENSYFKVAGVSLPEETIHSIDVKVKHEAKGTRSEVFLSNAPVKGKYSCGVRTDIEKPATSAHALQRLKTHLTDSSSSTVQRPQLNIKPASVGSAEHGSTIGQLSVSAVHFLRSRGFSEGDAARHTLLSELQPTLDHLPFPLQSVVLNKLRSRKNWE